MHARNLFRKWGQDVSAGVNFLNFLLAASKESWNGLTRNVGSVHFIFQGHGYYMHVYARISQLLRNDQVAQWVMPSHIQFRVVIKVKEPGIRLLESKYWVYLFTIDLKKLHDRSELHFGIFKKQMNITVFQLGWAGMCCKNNQPHSSLASNNKGLQLLFSR